MLSHLIVESPGEGDREALLAVLKLRSGRWGGWERTDELEQPSNQTGSGHTSPRAGDDWHGLHTRWLAQDSG